MKRTKKLELILPIAFDVSCFMCLLTLPFRSTRPNIPSPRKTSPIQLAQVESDPSLLIDGCDCNIIIIANRCRKMKKSVSEVK